MKILEGCGSFFFLGCLATVILGLVYGIDDWELFLFALAVVVLVVIASSKSSSNV